MIYGGKIWQGFAESHFDMDIRSTGLFQQSPFARPQNRSSFGGSPASQLAAAFGRGRPKAEDVSGLLELPGKKSSSVSDDAALFKRQIGNQAQTSLSELRQDGLRRLRDQFSTIEDILAEQGVDREQFRSVARGKLEALAATINGDAAPRALATDTADSDVANSAELNIQYQRANSASADFSRSGFSLSASASESLAFDFQASFTTRDGGSLNLDASFQLELRSDVSLSVQTGAGNAGGEADFGDASDRNAAEPSSPADVLSGLFARLRSFQISVEDSRSQRAEAPGRVERDKNSNSIPDKLEKLASGISLPPGALAFSITASSSQSSMQTLEANVGGNSYSLSRYEQYSSSFSLSVGIGVA